MKEFLHSPRTFVWWWVIANAVLAAAGCIAIVVGFVLVMADETAVSTRTGRLLVASSLIAIFLGLGSGVGFFLDWKRRRRSSVDRYI